MKRAKRYMVWFKPFILEVETSGRIMGTWAVHLVHPGPVKPARGSRKSRAVRSNLVRAVMGTRGLINRTISIGRDPLESWGSVSSSSVSLIFARAACHVGKE